ncbi:hypothetical protein B0J18DRAFT_482014 [Chaetomium sp. MPI-SDFR-AT-0129]|nr:hypothetical protein B0J18DRAFT_482014 [Chaetomium sp. MPI-SDFR-AT-0129]
MPKINNVVAVGCGTISRFEDADLRDHSMSQHALMLAIRDLVEARCRKQRIVQCFAQDPIYDPVDKAVLGDADITVLSDPRIWLEIDEGSVVISVGPNIPVLEIIADIARPLVLVISRPRLTEVAPRVRAMLLNEYIREEHFDISQALGDAAIFVRTS